LLGNEFKIKSNFQVDDLKRILMEGTLGIILSVLSATATAIWSVWTWNEQQEDTKALKRDQIATQYVNPFLISGQQLHSVLYGILNENELEFYKKENPETDPESYPEEVIELLYVLVRFFGWGWYLYRYSPYGNDETAVRLARKVTGTFANYKDFSSSVFFFSFSEQISLGQTFVKRIESGSEYPEFESVSLYEFAEELSADIKRNRPLYQDVVKSLQAIGQASHIQELEGRERLLLIQHELVDLLDYLEGKEGISVSLRNRKKASLGGSIPSHFNAEVVHHVSGRIRLRIPRLHEDQSYTEQLRSSIQYLAGVQTININSEASSIAVSYNPTLSESEIQQQVLAIVGQLG
jgi:hypothetical protein